MTETVDTATETAETTEAPKVEAKDNGREALMARVAVIAANPDFKPGDPVEVEPKPDGKADEPEADKTAEPADEKKEDAPAIDDETYKAGESLGLSREDVDRIGEVTTWRLAAKAKRETVTEKKDEPKADKPWEFTPVKVELSEEDFDPKIVAAVKAIESSFNTQMEAAHKRLKELDTGSIKEQVDILARDRANAQQERFIEWADAQFTALGEDFADVFGKGSLGKMDQKSDAFKRRVALLNDVSVLAEGQRAAGQSPDREALFKMLFNGRHREDIQRIAGRKTQTQLRDRKGQFSAPPSGRQGPPESKQEARDRRIREIAANPDYKHEKTRA